jgi:hypothetical protein
MLIPEIDQWSEAVRKGFLEIQPDARVDVRFDGGEGMEGQWLRVRCYVGNYGASIDLKGQWMRVQINVSNDVASIGLQGADIDQAVLEAAGRRLAQGIAALSRSEQEK